MESELLSLGLDQPRTSIVFTATDLCTLIYVPCLEAWSRLACSKVKYSMNTKNFIGSSHLYVRIYMYVFICTYLQNMYVFTKFTTTTITTHCPCNVFPKTKLVTGLEPYTAQGKNQLQVCHIVTKNPTRYGMGVVRNGSSDGLSVKLIA